MHPTRTRAILSGVALLTATLLGAVPTPANAATASGCFLDARTGAHTGFDRLVFDISGSTADYLPGLVATEANTTGIFAFEDGKDHTAAIPGKNYLYFTFAGCIYDPVTGQVTYTTPNPEAISLPSLKGVERYGADGIYEGFILSLGDYSTYKVSTLTAPDRFIIDIYH